MEVNTQLFIHIGNIILMTGVIWLLLWDRARRKKTEQENKVPVTDSAKEAQNSQ